MDPLRVIPKRAAGASSENTALLGTVPSVVTQRYCITALCTVDHADEVKQLMRHELCRPEIRVDQIGLKSHSSHHLVRVVAVVSCAARARSVLFRLVNCLGLDAGVRSIRWETAASPPSDATGHRFAARAVPTHSTTMWTTGRAASANQ